MVGIDLGKGTPIWVHSRRDGGRVHIVQGTSHIRLSEPEVHEPCRTAPTGGKLNRPRRRLW